MEEAMIPLWELVQGRRQALGLGSRELVRRCGFSNIAHGLRALAEFWEGDLSGADAKRLVDTLPAALEMSPTVFNDAVAAFRAVVEQRARDAFVPCAWLTGTTSRPSQITIFALTGGAGRWLRIPLDLDQSPLTYASQALAVAKRTPEVKFFGPVTGFVVSYSHDSSVRFDLEGRPVERLRGPFHPGMASVSLSGRKLPLVAC